jgi:hypothetical protein
MGNHYVPHSSKRRPNTIKGTDARISILLPADEKAALDKIVQVCRLVVPAVNLSCFVRKALQDYARHLNIYASDKKDLDTSMLRSEIRSMVQGTYADSSKG